MPLCVVDASVVLAFLDEEEGADAAADALEDAALSAVNLAEVIARLIKGGLPADEVEGVLAPFPFVVIPFDGIEQPVVWKFCRRLITHPGIPT